ncbi:MAG: CRISPR-associated endonuclease Cas6 [Bacteroidota bacterium]
MTTTNLKLQKQALNFKPSNLQTGEAPQTLEHLNTRTLYLSFDLPLYTRQIPQWRGAFLEMAAWEDHLFHNHKGESEEGDFHYRYPLIQYRVRRKKAAIFAIGEGVQALQKVLATSDWQINWQGQTKTLQVEDLRMNSTLIKTTTQPQSYKLYKWLALNQKNYELWQKCNGLIERTQLLQNILRGHLLAALWGMRWREKVQIEVCIQEIRRSQTIPLKGIKHTTFDIVYTTNVQLPNHIALGKAVSRGFGWQVKV